MYLSRVELKPETSSKPEFWASLGDVYAEHQLIWQLFGHSPTQQRDFLFRKEGAGAKARWYTVSNAPPQDVRGMWTIENRALETRFPPGTRLRFAVRVNPTVKKAVSKTKSVRHDVVMNLKLAAPAGSSPKKNENVVQEACTAWLKARSEKNGFSFESEQVRFDAYRQVRGRSGEKISISTVDIDGVLTVRDPEAFGNMLTRGLGPAKGFGCGLMLVRPV